MSADSSKHPPGGQPGKGPEQAPGHSHTHTHDHSHGHGHGHGHEHGHDHEHDHGHAHAHSHSHSHSRSHAPVPAHGPASASAPGPWAPETGESDDAGAVALAEALRSSFVIVRVLLAALVLYFLGSGIFTVTSQERAIILRFGEPVRRGGQVEIGAGLHWAFPSPIDEVIKMPVAQLQTATSTVGWYAVTPAQEAEGQEPDAGPSLNPALEGYAITGDGNIIHTRASVRYRITEPLKFFLNHRDGAAVLTNLIDNALTYAAARYRFDDAVRRDVTGFKEVALKRLSDLVAAHDLGITLEASPVDTLRPRQVKTEFAGVTSAEQERSKVLSDANTYSNRVVNEARGMATARVHAGEADRNRLVQSVAAEARTFANLLPEYRKNPGYFRDRFQTEALRRILTNAQEKFYAPLGTSDELRLMINREPVKPPKQVLP